MILDYIKQVNFPVMGGKTVRITEVMRNPLINGYDMLVPYKEKYVLITINRGDLMQREDRVIEYLYDTILEALGQNRIFINSKLHETLYGKN